METYPKLRLQEAVSRLQTNWGKEEISKTMNANFGLSDLDIGPFIAKGCDAVVYAAALKDPNPQQRTDSPDIQPTASPAHTHRAEIMSPIQNTSRFVHNFGGSVDNVHYNTTSIDLDLVATGDDFRRQSISQRRPRFDSISETDNDEVAETISAAIPQSDINRDNKVSIYLPKFKAHRTDSHVVYKRHYKKRTNTAERFLKIKIWTYITNNTRFKQNSAY